MSADADKLKMNSENSLKISEKKLSSVDDDFESLFEEEEINIDSQNKKEALDFNDLFEAISEEPEDSVEHISGESHSGNVEEDFEALLADETESESNTNEDKSTKESPNDQSLVTGFSQIFSSHNPLQSSDNPVNIHLPEPGNTLTQDKPAEDNLEEELAALKQEMFAERQSFQMQMIHQAKKMSSLKEEVENLRNRLNKTETEKNATEERICDLLEKQKVNFSIKLSSEKEEDPDILFQTTNNKLKAQENIINQLKEEIERLRNDKKDLNGTKEEEDNYTDHQVKPEDPNQKILSLVHELNDQKEVSEKLKAYVGEVLENVMVTNPQVLERKKSWSK